jgi:hypothetical protein
MIARTSASTEEGAAMRKFLAKHAAATTGTVSGFDRVLFKGHLPLGYPHAMEEFLQRHGVLFKRLKGFVLQQAERLWTHSHVMAERASRPWQYFESPVRKDERARSNPSWTEPYTETCGGRHAAKPPTTSRRTTSRSC